MIIIVRSNSKKEKQTKGNFQLLNERSIDFQKSIFYAQSKLKFCFKYL